jgi:MFS family permease
MFSKKFSVNQFLKAKRFSSKWFKQTFKALRHRNFRLFWFGQMISLVGTWMQWAAQGWLVLRLSNSVFLLGLVSAFNSLPVLLFSFPAGVLADKLKKRNLLFITQSILMILALILAFLSETKLVRVWHVMILAFFTGCANAFDAPIRQSFVVEMVGKEDLMNAIALNSSVFNGARIAGPSIAGILIALFGEAVCFLLNGISYLAVILGLLLMKNLPYFENPQEGSYFQRLKSGITYIRSNSPIFSILTLVGITSIFAMPYAALMPVFARDILKKGPEGLGFLMTSVGLGALIAGLSLASRESEKKFKYLIYGAATLSTFLVVFSFSRNFLLSCLALFFFGWGMITQTATSNTILQATVPDHLRGRVMGVFAMMFMGLMPIGSFLAGTAAYWIGVDWTLRIGGIVCGIMAFFLLRKKFDQKSLF